MTANLLSRLQGLTAPDREVDALIWAHLAGVKYVGHYQAYSSFGNNPLTQVEFRVPPKRKPIVTSDRGQYQHATPVTASLDAAVALCERVLPGWQWAVWGGAVEAGSTKPRCMAHVSDGRTQWTASDTPNAAIALIIAILTALEARENG